MGEPRNYETACYVFLQSCFAFFDSTLLDADLFLGGYSPPDWLFQTSGCPPRWQSHRTKSIFRKYNKLIMLWYMFWVRRVWIWNYVNHLPPNWRRSSKMDARVVIKHLRPLVISPVYLYNHYIFFQMVLHKFRWCHNNVNHYINFVMRKLHNIRTAEAMVSKCHKSTPWGV